MIARDVEAAGDTLFQTYCAVCHGIAGDAKGPVSSRIGAPSLLTGRARAYSDGYIYSIIRYGRGVMPRYGDKVYLPSDRWAIVNHVRKLQGQTPLAPEPANAAVGIPPAPSATGSTGERPR
jgi:mono/diheme cytochrome c family protein